jgi:hypothetical protein
MGPSWDHPFVRESHVQDNVTQMQHDQEDIPVEAVHEEPPIVALNLSPTAQDFAASGGVLPVDAEAIVPVSVHPSPSKVQVNHEVASLTFFVSALSRLHCIHSAFISSLDLDLDLLLPQYLSLNNVVDIVKLIKDETCFF